MCRCALGTPAGIAQRSDEFQRNTKLMFQMWQNQSQLFTPQDQPSVDIPVPQLLEKRTVPESPPVLRPPGVAPALQGPFLQSPQERFLAGSTGTLLKCQSNADGDTLRFLLADIV